MELTTNLLLVLRENICILNRVPSISEAFINRCLGILNFGYRYRRAITLTIRSVLIPRPCEKSPNIVSFYDQVLLASRPTHKLECHPLSAVRDCLFSIFAAVIHIWRPFLHPHPEDAPCRGNKDPLVRHRGRCRAFVKWVT